MYVFQNKGSVHLWLVVPNHRNDVLNGARLSMMVNHNHHYYEQRMTRCRVGFAVYREEIQPQTDCKVYFVVCCCFTLAPPHDAMNPWWWFNTSQSLVYSVVLLLYLMRTAVSEIPTCKQANKHSQQQQTITMRVQTKDERIHVVETSTEASQSRKNRRHENIASQSVLASTSTCTSDRPSCYQQQPQYIVYRYMLFTESIAYRHRSQMKCISRRYGT